MLPISPIGHHTMEQCVEGTDNGDRRKYRIIRNHNHGIPANTFVKDCTTSLRRGAGRGAGSEFGALAHWLGLLVPRATMARLRAPTVRQALHFVKATRPVMFMTYICTRALRKTVCWATYLNHLHRQSVTPEWAHSRKPQRMIFTRPISRSFKSTVRNSPPDITLHGLISLGNLLIWPSTLLLICSTIHIRQLEAHGLPCKTNNNFTKRDGTTYSDKTG